MSNGVVVGSLVLTIVFFVVLWVEDCWKDFYHWGPPFEIGSIVIRTWSRWWMFVGLLVLYQASHVYIEETFGRDMERKHIQKQPFHSDELFILACYNFYKWLGTILHILVAVTRLDIWMAIAAIDTVARLMIWHGSTGRRPRFFTA